MANLEVDGHLIVFDQITGDAGDHHGLARVVIPVQFDSLEEAFGQDPQSVADAMSLGRCKCVARPIKTWANNKFIVSFQFEGQNAEATYEETGDQTTYAIEGTMEEVGFEAHPHFGVLDAIYGWDFAKGQFGDVRADNQEASDIAGAQSFLSRTVTFTATTVSATCPANLLSELVASDPIIAEPAGLAIFGISTPSGRNWLAMSPQVTQLGSEGRGPFRIVRTYRLSGPNGWNSDVYNLSSFEEA